MVPELQGNNSLKNSRLKIQKLWIRSQTDNRYFRCFQQKQSHISVYLWNCERLWFSEGARGVTRIGQPLCSVFYISTWRCFQIVLDNVLYILLILEMCSSTEHMKQPWGASFRVYILLLLITSMLISQGGCLPWKAIQGLTKSVCLSLFRKIEATHCTCACHVPSSFEAWLAHSMAWFWSEA